MLRFYLFAMGAILVAYGAMTAYARMRNLSRWALAEGVVVACIDRPDSEDGSAKVYFARIAFCTSDGRRFEFNSSIGGTQAPVLGRAIAVKYDPENPNRAVENSAVAKWGFSVLILLLGVVSVVAAVLSRSI